MCISTGAHDIFMFRFLEVESLTYNMLLLIVKWVIHVAIAYRKAYASVSHQGFCQGACAWGLGMEGGFSISHPCPLVQSSVVKALLKGLAWLH